VIKVPEDEKIEFTQTEEDERPPDSFNETPSSSNELQESSMSADSDYFDDDDHLRIQSRF
jgi:hypothetical protein